MFTVSSSVKSFTKLKALKYRGMRDLYPHISSHYGYIACQDVSARAKRFLKLKKPGLVERGHPEVGSV